MGEELCELAGLRQSPWSADAHACALVTWEIHPSGHVVPGARQGQEGGDMEALVSLMLNPRSCY